MTASNTPHVSIVVPIYNEEDNVQPLCEAIRKALQGSGLEYEAVLVDDGSSDATSERLREEARLDARIRVIMMRRNAGQTLAMATGFAHARGTVIVSMDGDLQNDPRDIPLLVSRLDQGFDVVCGWRKNRKDAWLSRTFPSKVANKLIATLTGINIHDNGCSLKAYRAEVIRSLNLYSEMHRFLPALSSMTGARIDEVVVRHHPRVHGESKYWIARTFKVFSDMFAIKMVVQFATRPGLWFGMLSLPWLALGLLTLTWWMLDLWVFDRAGSIIFPSLTMMLFFLFGHMITFSILSESLLAQTDRRYLRRLAEVLTVTTRHGRPGRAEK